MIRGAANKFEFLSFLYVSDFDVPKIRINRQTTFHVFLRKRSASFC